MGSSTPPSNWATTIFVPLLGVIICFFMWFSPFKVLCQARKTRDIGDINPIPFVFTIMNCIGWSIYGCLRKDPFIFCANAPGAIVGTFYTINVLSLLAKKGGTEEGFSDQYIIVESLFIFAITFWLVAGFTAAVSFDSFSSPLGEAATMIGTLSCCFAVAYYGAPLSNMVPVIKNRDASTLYPPTIIINLINASLWTIYGFVLNDYNLLIPNGLGCLLALFQLILIILFRNKNSTDHHRKLTVPSKIILD